MRYLPDTNVLRELGKTSPQTNVADWLTSINAADLAISAPTVREVAKGVAKLRKTKPETLAALGAIGAATFDAFEGRRYPMDPAVGDIVDPQRGDMRLLHDVEQLPKRVRPKKCRPHYEEKHPCQSVVDSGFSSYRLGAHQRCSVQS